MAITKEKKKEILEKLKDVTGKNSVVFVNFHGLPVDETTSMRAKLREENVSYFVAKKTLVRKAFGDASIKGELPELDGELAIVYGDDATAPAREVYAFQKSSDERVHILGGIFEGKYLDREAMEEIAKIPSIDILRGMFVNVINSPIQGFVMTLKAYAEKQEA